MNLFTSNSPLDLVFVSFVRPLTGHPLLFFQAVPDESLFVPFPIREGRHRARAPSLSFSGREPSKRNEKKMRASKTICDIMLAPTNLGVRIVMGSNLSDAATYLHDLALIFGPSDGAADLLDR